MESKCVFVLSVILAALAIVSAVTEDEKTALRTAVRPILDACETEFDLTKEKVLAAKEAGDIDAIDPCFYACFFKKTGVINEEGLFDLDVTLEKNKKYIKGEEDITKITQIGNTCLSVNEENVSDTEKGCERAKLLLACLMKEKANFTPFTSSA